MSATPTPGGMSLPQPSESVDGLMAVIEDYGSSCYSTGDGCLDGCGEQFFPLIRAYVERLISPSPQKQTAMSERYAPAGKVWLCMMCGKTAKDSYGEERGWDESCALNCILVDESTKWPTDEQFRQFSEERVRHIEASAKNMRYLTESIGDGTYVPDPELLALAEQIVREKDADAAVIQNTAVDERMAAQNSESVDGYVQGAGIDAALAAPGIERLREWAAIGPVQRAAVEEFARVLAAGVQACRCEREGLDKALCSAGCHIHHVDGKLPAGVAVVQAPSLTERVLPLLDAVAGGKSCAQAAGDLARELRAPGVSALDSPTNGDQTPMDPKC